MQCVKFLVALSFIESVTNRCTKHLTNQFTNRVELHVGTCHKITVHIIAGDERVLKFSTQARLVVIVVQFLDAITRSHVYTPAQGAKMVLN